ncbi:DUF3093 family protein [Agromyces sp. CFH 90414]|uniref:DUF3093 family protein n=1 Tax=Agromyces agglutinans TaxID=2662258 RepID=A0A6I2F328_9MICO|nr:DUF3093 domain-containing protein [Agromyces agglutinans]MRG58601.1 DUF3093 family protein [Agromyces agglutinans]
MSDYRERMWPSPWIWVACLLLIPSSILVLAPVSVPAGVVTGIVLYAGVLGALSFTAPVVEVSAGRLRAGRAEIPLEQTGEAVAVDADASRAELGTRLDARAFLVIRGWIRPLVRVPIVDDADPTPYWLVSSRRADELAAAINRSRRPDAQ